MFNNKGIFGKVFLNFFVKENKKRITKILSNINK